VQRQFLTRREVAEILGLSLSTVNRGIRDQRAPFSAFVRVGRRLICPLSALVALGYEVELTELAEEVSQ